jgi:hypothetical protein
MDGRADDTTDGSADDALAMARFIVAMRECSADLVVLDKDATTGDTIVRTGACSRV